MHEGREEDDACAITSVLPRVTNCADACRGRALYSSLGETGGPDCTGPSCACHCYCEPHITISETTNYYAFKDFTPTSRGTCGGSNHTWVEAHVSDTAAECATFCRGRLQWFTFEAQGSDTCSESEGCPCICHNPGTPLCFKENNDNIRLYEFSSIMAYRRLAEDPVCPTSSGQLSLPGAARGSVATCAAAALYTEDCGSDFSYVQRRITPPSLKSKCGWWQCGEASKPSEHARFNATGNSGKWCRNCFI